MENKTIFISGTPGVGKTTIVELLKKEYNNKIEIININEFSKEKDLFIGVDSEKGYKIIDIDLLNKALNENINKKKLTIVEGHVSHLCDDCDKLIVLRLDPNILKQRLKDRDYSESKIKENLEAEALGVCSMEGYGIHPTKLNEIDTTNLRKDEVIETIKLIIENEKALPIGKIDFTSWFLIKS